MKKLVFTLLALIALFSALRAIAEPVSAAGVDLQPGLVEVSDGASSVGMAFGVMEKSSGATSLWNLLPLRVIYRSGDTSVSMGLNGLSFLLRGGVSVGRQVRVDKPRAGDVISIGGKVTVGSRVDGDVWTLGADVELGPQAEVTGDVVALGGKVLASPKAVVRGSVSQVPELKIPFLGVLGTQFSAQALGVGRQLLGYVLLGFALFLSCFYRAPRARGMYQSLSLTWRETLITLAVSLVVVPLVAALLIVSVIGIFLLPILVFLLILMALEGFLLLCARLGGAVRRPAGAGVEPLWLFTSGMLGLFLVKAPALVGIFITLFRSETAAKAGEILQLITLGCMAAGLLYGWGSALAHARSQAARQST
ncbi:MAG: hypothetical protein ABSF77_07425 [Spirochaetia bacterium]|jgi:hypothetical protein